MAEPAQNLRIVIANRADDTVVELGGELDAGTVAEMDEQLRRAMSDGQGDLLLDMAEVTFCDSSALRSIVGAVHELRQSGRQLHIVNPSERVTRLLELTDLQALADGPDRKSTSE